MDTLRGVAVVDAASVHVPAQNVILGDHDTEQVARGRSERK